MLAVGLVNHMSAAHTRKVFYATQGIHLLCKINCDRAYKNRSCERKLHRVIFSLISFILNALFYFRKLQKKAH